MAKIRKSDRRKYCIGCRDNFYNGNNEYGIKECWCLDDAKVVKKKFVPMDMRPPWDIPPQKTLSCYRKKGYVAVDPKVLY